MRLESLFTLLIIIACTFGGMLIAAGIVHMIQQWREERFMTRIDRIIKENWRPRR
jgi:hypothetical protein